MCVWWKLVPPHTDMLVLIMQHSCNLRQGCRILEVVRIDTSVMTNHERWRAGFAGRDPRELVHLIRPRIDLCSPGGGKQVPCSRNMIERCSALTSEAGVSSLCTFRRNNATYSLFVYSVTFLPGFTCAVEMEWKLGTRVVVSTERQSSSVSAYWCMLRWLIWRARLDPNPRLVFN